MRDGAVRLVAAVLLLAGCGAERGVADSAPTEPTLAVAGRSFVVVDVADPRRGVVPGSVIRLEFTGDSLAVQAGCNNIGGAYEVTDDGTLAVDQLGGTEMGCDQPLMAQDAWIIAFLSAAPDLELDGNHLVLRTRGTTLTLREQVAESAPVQGTVWRLESLVDGRGPDAVVASVPPAGAEAELRIEDGQLTLRYACTTVSAAVQVGEARIEAGEVEAASGDCAAIPDLERRVRALLREPAAYVVTERNLMLTSADGATGLGFAADPS